MKLILYVSSVSLHTVIVNFKVKLFLPVIDPYSKCHFLSIKHNIGFIGLL